MASMPSEMVIGTKTKITVFSVVGSFFLSFVKRCRILGPMPGAT